ncbi:MAG: GDP-mannose 4,6-dehydratase [Candidatus Nanoarchaeia archaeon]|jgi:UDP-glucuronate 4-epimerase
MKILLTGAAGFIGSNLLGRLLNEGHFVVGIDNFDPLLYSTEHKINNLKDYLKMKNFVFESADINDSFLIKKIFKNNNFDTVIHMAARAGVRTSIENPKGYHSSNIGGTLTLLEAAKDFNVKNFIFASSSSIYGNSKSIPFNENDPADRPISPYAMSKRACEMICYTYSHLYDLNVICLRFFTVYGPRQRPEMAIHQFIRKIDKGEELTLFGDGTSSRDYTYIDDITEGIITCLSKSLKYEIINLGNNSPTKLKDLIVEIENALGKKAKIKYMPMQPGDVDVTYADISKAKKLLNYCPKTSIQDGIRKSVEWYNSNNNFF